MGGGSVIVCVGGLNEKLKNQCRSEHTGVQCLSRYANRMSQGLNHQSLNKQTSRSAS